MRMIVLSAVVLRVLLGAAETAAQTAPAPEPIWQQTLERPLRFHRLVDEDLLVTGTGRHLYAFDPATGELRWRERNVNPARQDVYRLPGTDTLLIADSAGGRFDDLDTHVLALSARDGRLVWESPRLPGRAMQGVMTGDAGTLYATTVGEAHGDDNGVLASPISGKGFGAGVFREPQLVSLNLRTGEVIWQAPFGREVRLAPGTGQEDRGERPFDLGNYHRPVIVDRMLCVTYFGIRCLNRLTGATIWDHEFPVIEDELALAYSRPVVVGDTIYAAGDNRVHAFDLLSGEERWRSRKANVIPEIQVDGDTVYSQLGGRFFHLGKERWVWKGEFGVMAIDRGTGKARWRFDDAKGAISNLHYESELIWFADARRLYALDRRTGKRVLRARHRMHSPPTFVVLNSHGQLVLIADDEMVALDRRGRELWTVHHPAPGPGAWRRASAGLFQVSGGMLRIASMAVSLAGGMLPAIPAVAGVSIISSTSVARTATRSAGDQLISAGESMGADVDYGALENLHQYFLTTSGRDGQIHLAAVNIDTGLTVGYIPLPSASPDIVIDDERGALLQAAGNTLTALRIR